MAKGIKTGGRDKGTPNRLTKELRLILKQIVFNELSELPERLEKMETDKRTEILIKLIPYVLPKVESVSMDKGEGLFPEWD